MKIGIVTLLFSTNYGGILQAYALQTILQRMGHEVTILNINHANHTRIKRIKLGVKNIIKSVLRRKKDEENLLMTQHTNKFIVSYIDSIVDLSIHPRQLDAIVVGSDQVWRPKCFYSSIIHKAYLDFAKKWDVKRISYAASFGTDQWEYTPEQTAMCGELLRKFDAVSVRESSAINLCADHFGVVSQHVLDPTMLLEREDYIKLVESSATKKSSGNLNVYILDNTPDKQIVVDGISKRYSLTPFKTNSRVGDPTAPIAERIQPPVEEWLRGFMDAESVVTDSFHACVFSIIFNKPFIVYGNTSRGAARFHSLLALFGLERQFISSSSELDLDSCFQIDWTKVNSDLINLKKHSTHFLLNALK